MATLREQILQALAARAATVSGIAATSRTRERATPVAASECPALDLAPDSEPNPQALGTGADRRDLAVAFKIHTAGDGAYALADPIVQTLHAALYADQTLGGLATSILPGATDFARDDADQTIGRTTVRYTVVYTTRRSDLAAKARS